MVDDGKGRAARTALITGAAGVIGAGLVSHFVDAGWRVIAADSDGRGLRGLKGAERLELDVSDEGAVAACFDGLARLDLLVNCAGIADPDNGPVERLDLTEWNRRLAVNLTGPMLMVKHGARALRAAGGSVVNISSTRAAMSEPNSEAYAASKGGIEALTHALAISLGPDIRVNAVAPGWIAGEPDELSEEDHRQHPAGRVGRAEDIARAVEWLADAGFTTGQTVTVDGGMTRKMIYD